MATFLQLVNKVERESGTVGQSQRLSSVANPVGRQEKIVQWTAQAWEMIQRERTDWTFRRREFTTTLTIGQKRYDSPDADFSGWERDEMWSLYDNDIGQEDETELRVISYDEWRRKYDFGTHDANRPIEVAFDGQRRLCIGPKPDKAYILRGSCKRAIQTLTLDADTPIIDEEFHDIIVWRALLLLAEHDEAPFPISTAAMQYRRFNGAMLRAYTEMVELA